MDVTFDEYSLRARIIPVLIVATPLVLVIVSLYPEKFTGWDLLISLIGASGVGVLLEHLGRDRGKKVQEYLFSRWGGVPTTIVLRHNSNEINAISLERYHSKLRKLLNIKLPTAEEEESDSSKADLIYDSCSHYLRSKTRSAEQYARIHQENVNYGFRRNLWGLKPYALLILVLTTFIPISQILGSYESLNNVMIITWCVLLIQLVLIVFWTKVVIPDWIKVPAFEYAKQLIMACDSIEIKKAESKRIIRWK